MWCIQYHPILTKFQIVYIQYNYLSPDFLKSFWQHKVPTRIELNLDFPNLRQEGAKSSRCGLALGTEGTPSSRATSIKQGELKGSFIPANILLDLSFFEVVFSETLSESWLLLKGFTHTATQQSLLNNRTKSIRSGNRECSIHLKLHRKFNKQDEITKFSWNISFKNK